MLGFFFVSLGFQRRIQNSPNAINIRNAMAAAMSLVMGLMELNCCPGLEVLPLVPHSFVALVAFDRLIDKPSHGNSGAIACRKGIAEDLRLAHADTSLTAGNFGCVCSLKASIAPSRCISAYIGSVTTHHFLLLK